MHLWLLHARLRRQSELKTHSGLQVGGLPENPWTQEQTACSLIVRHWLLGPQGVGLQGLITSRSEKNDILCLSLNVTIFSSHKDMYLI